MVTAFGCQEVQSGAQGGASGRFSDQTHQCVVAPGCDHECLWCPDFFDTGLLLAQASLEDGGRNEWRACLEGRRALLVEDNEFNQQVAVELLGAWLVPQ